MEWMWDSIIVRFGGFLLSGIRARGAHDANINHFLKG